MKPAGSVWVLDGKIDKNTLVVPRSPRMYLDSPQDEITPFFRLGVKRPVIALTTSMLEDEGYKPFRAGCTPWIPDWLKKPKSNNFILSGSESDFWVGVESIRGRYVFVTGLAGVEDVVTEWQWAYDTSPCDSLYTTICLDLDDAIEYLQPKFHEKSLTVWERLRSGGLGV